MVETRPRGVAGSGIAAPSDTAASYPVTDLIDSREKIEGIPAPSFEAVDTYPGNRIVVVPLMAPRDPATGHRRLTEAGTWDVDTIP